MFTKQRALGTDPQSLEAFTHWCCVRSGDNTHARSRKQPGVLLSTLLTPGPHLSSSSAVNLTSVVKTAQRPEAAFGPGCHGAALCPLPSWSFFSSLPSSQKADRDALHPVCCTAGLLTGLFWSCSAVFARGMDCHSAFPVFSSFHSAMEGFYLIHPGSNFMEIAYFG